MSPNSPQNDITEETEHSVNALHILRDAGMSEELADAVKEARAALRNVQLAVAKEIVNQRG